jgi:hypothetical protein
MNRVHNFVIGFAQGKQFATLVFNPADKEYLHWNHEDKITPERARDIYDIACAYTGVKLSRILLEHSELKESKDNIGSPAIFDISYSFVPEENRLTYFSFGNPVWSDSNGEVCSDDIALYNSRLREELSWANKTLAQGKYELPAD